MSYMLRSARYLENVVAMVKKLPDWKEQRLPQPRTNRSQYDKVGLTCECCNALKPLYPEVMQVLLWMWTMSHGPMAPLMFKYIMPML